MTGEGIPNLNLWFNLTGEDIQVPFREGYEAHQSEAQILLGA